MGAAVSVKASEAKVAGKASTHAISIEPQIMDEYKLNYRTIRLENDGCNRIGHESFMQLLQSLSTRQNKAVSSVRPSTSQIKIVVGAFSVRFLFRTGLRGLKKFMSYLIVLHAER